MTNNERFREKIIEQNGIAPQGISPEDREALQRILKRDRARVRRMKWATIIAWSALVCIFAVGLALSHTDYRGSGASGFGITILVPLFYLAIFFTVSYVIRASIARHREQQAHMAEIETRLAETQEAIKRIAEKLE